MLFLALLAAGSLSGKVTIIGLAPRLADLPVTRDLKSCGSSKPDEALEAGPDNGIRNAVVWIPSAGEKKADRKERFKLDQQTCQFVPHVVVAPLGSTLDVTNSDNVLHNARATEGESVKLFNYAMPIQGHVVPTRLRKEGIFKVACDVHPWMRAWLLVLETDKFAVTDEKGEYRIEGLAPGKYKAKIWHERLGEKEQEIEIAEGQTASWNVAYTPK